MDLPILGQATTPPARTGPPYEPWLALTALAAGLVGAALRRRARST